MRNNYKEINVERLKEIVLKSDSFVDVVNELGYSLKEGHAALNIRRHIKRNNISTEHFSTVQKIKDSKIRYEKETLIRLVNECKTLKEILCELDLLPIDSNYKTLKKHLSLNNIDYSHIKSRNNFNKIINKNYEINKFSEIISSSLSYKEVFQKLGLDYRGNNYATIHKYIDIYQLNTSHFNVYSERVKTLSRYNKIPLSLILVENSEYKSTNNLKKRLYNENILERKCILCGQNENWNGAHMSLILDHINGVSNDNRIKNLRIVCPNCNATLPTFAGKNIKTNRDKIITPKIRKKKIRYCNKCGSPHSGKSGICITCSRIKSRKVEHPTHEQLLMDIKELGYSGTGRKYGVSDNAIRKWVK